MKTINKNIVFLFCLLISLQCFSQNEIKLHFGLTQKIGSVFGNMPLYHSKYENRVPYSETSAQIGIQKPIFSGALAISVSLQSYGNLKSKDISAFYQKDNFLGLNLKYKLSKDKRFSPFIAIGGFIQLNTNYRNGNIDWENFNPSEKTIFGNATFDYDNLYNDGWGIPDLPSYTFRTFYLATPFVGNLSFGYEMHITKGLFINLAVVSSTRFVQTKTLWFDGSYITEGFDESTIEELLKNEPVEMTLLNDIGFRLGLSYAFSLKKSQVKK